MSINLILWTLGTIAIIALVAVPIIQSAKRKLLKTVSELKKSNALFSNTEIGTNLNDFLKALSSDNAEKKFLLLEKLKNNPTGCLREFTETFEKLSEYDYNAKWMIVYSISQFELPDFIKLLSKIADSEIPKEKSRSIHLYSTVSEETVIRLRAIEGLKSIGEKGFKEAQTELFRLLRSQYLTLNIAACQSLMIINEENRTRILELLPKDKHYIINIKPKKVNDIAIIKNPDQFITNVNERNEAIPKPGKHENNPQQYSAIIEKSKSPKISQ